MRTFEHCQEARFTSSRGPAAERRNGLPLPFPLAAEGDKEHLESAVRVRDVPSQLTVKPPGLGMSDPAAGKKTGFSGSRGAAGNTTPATRPTVVPVPSPE